MSVQSVADRLVALCRQNKFVEATQELYDDNILSVELMSMPNMPAEIRGKQAVIGKAEWWVANHTIHSTKTSNPLIADGWFAVTLSIDVTNKQTNQRTAMTEIAVYKVKNDKIVEERFFYPTE